MYKILIVDDDQRNVKLLTTILQNQGYNLETASNGQEAIQKTMEFMPDLILLDVVMPLMNGYEACQKIKEMEEIKHIPVILITFLTDRDSRIKGLEVGASDFLTKPIDSTEIVVRCRNLIKIREYELFLTEYNQRLEKDVEKQTLQLKEAFIELEKSRITLKESYQDTIYHLTRVAEFKDEETSFHIKRVSFYATRFGEEFGFSEDRIENFTLASPMHDIGKVGIPSEILLKTSKLTPEEFNLMKTHTIIGSRILQDSISPILKLAEKIALSHHERWDGSGYPSGLKGEEIMLEARIFNIIDQYDALRSKRPYKLPFDHDKSFAIITRGDGRTIPGHFDPQILEVFNKVHQKLADIFEKHSE